MDNSNQFKVRLESYAHGTSSVPTTQVIFDVMPTITESISVDYQALDPVHMPGSFYVYKGTKSSTYEIGDIKLVSRSPQEATKNQAIRNSLRGWTKPFFGMGTATGAGTITSSATQQVTKKEWQKVTTYGHTTALTAQDVSAVLTANNFVNPGTIAPTLPLSEKQKQTLLSATNKQKAQALLTQMYATTQSPMSSPLFSMAPGSYKHVSVTDTVTSETSTQRGKMFLGAPPEVLYLTAYSDPTAQGGQLDRATNIYRVPVVITNLGVTYPNDVDYIPTLEGEMFPIIMTLSLSLVETHSPREFERFDLFKYRDGRLPGF